MGGANIFVFDSSFGSGTLATKGEVVAPDEAPVVAAKGLGFGASATTLVAKGETVDALVLEIGSASAGLGYSAGLKRELPVFAAVVAGANGLAFNSAVFGGANIPEVGGAGLGRRADTPVAEGFAEVAGLVGVGANNPLPTGAVEV